MLANDAAGTARQWIVRGPLGKLYRVTKYILASSQRRKEFGETAGGRKVKEFDHLSVSVLERVFLKRKDDSAPALHPLHKGSISLIVELYHWISKVLLALSAIAVMHKSLIDYAPSVAIC